MIFMAELVKLIRIVDAVRAFEQSQPFRYYAITDDRTCEACMKYDGDWFSWEDMVNTFPDLERISDATYLPHIHPNCRCQIIRER